MESLDTGGPRFKEMFEIVKFYEEAAGKVKSRTWTISAWVYTLNSALFTFCFGASAQNSVAFSLTAFGACVAGIALSIALSILIQNQGEHLEEYMAYQHKACQADETLHSIVDVGEPEFPGFCRSLNILTRLYLTGFVIAAFWIASAIAASAF